MGKLTNERELLIEGCELLGIEINNKEVDIFLEYMSILLEWNKKINITSITDKKDFIIKHFLDSLTCIKTFDFKGTEKIIDIGTGGGFPGVPLKIMMPEIKLTLLDSTQKKVKFLNELVKKLTIENVISIHGRAEDYGNEKSYREKYDIAVSRAVAPMNILLEYCLPFVKKGGIFIAQKSSEIETELNEAKNSLKRLGGKIEQDIRLELPFSNDGRSIIIIRKTNKTPNNYPRRAGIPQKKPL